MKRYTFTTETTMKENNCDKYWVATDFVRPLTVFADDMATAIKQYVAEIYNRDYVTITPNAIKRKSPMFVDTPNGETMQVGYVFTGSAEFDCVTKHGTEWKKQYIDLWVTITQNITEW